MRKISKALIATAGFGTRLLPITKTIQKEMLPILNRPVIDYVVEDLIAAGVTDIIFVINEHNRQVKHYYQENPRLEQYLDNPKHQQQLADIKKLAQKAKFTFVNQPAKGAYGTAVPLQVSQSLLDKEEAFFVYMGDDFIFHTDKTSEAREMIELFHASQAEAVASFIPRPTDMLHQYGIAQYHSLNGHNYLEKIVEKPAIGMAPSSLANISKYIFTPKIFEYLVEQQPDKKSGEMYITDTLQSLAQQHPVVIHQPTGHYLDGGSVEGWLTANLVVAKQDPALKKLMQTALA